MNLQLRIPFIIHIVGIFTFRWFHTVFGSGRERAWQMGCEWPNRVQTGSKYDIAQQWIKITFHYVDDGHTLHGHGSLQISFHYRIKSSASRLLCCFFILVLCLHECPLKPGGGWFVCEWVWVSSPHWLFRRVVYVLAFKYQSFGLFSVWPDKFDRKWMV